MNQNNQQLNKKKHIDLSIVILCYKAENKAVKFVEKVENRLKNFNINNYELILVGNYLANSKDKTPKIVEKIASQSNYMTFVAKEKKGMMGWDMRSGLDIAKGNYISVIDGDGQMPTDDLIRVYKKIKNNKLDLVKTYRVKREDGIKRKIISNIYNLIFNILFPGLDSKDINSKPKIFSKSAYKKLNLKSNDWFIDAEIMIKARRHKFNIDNLPTRFEYLKGRKSFVGTKAIFEFIYNLFIYRIKEFFK